MRFQLKARKATASGGKRLVSSSQSWQEKSFLGCKAGGGDGQSLEYILKSKQYYVLSHFSRIQLFVTLWTVASQSPLSMGFSGQEYWRGFPCPPPGDLPDPGIEPASLMSPALAGKLFTASTTCISILL